MPVHLSWPAADTQEHIPTTKAHSGNPQNNSAVGNSLHMEQSFMDFSNMNLDCHHLEAMQAFSIFDISWQSVQEIKCVYCKEVSVHLACTSHLLLSFDALQLFCQMRYVMTLSHSPFMLADPYCVLFRRFISKPKNFPLFKRFLCRSCSIPDSSYSYLSSLYHNLPERQGELHTGNCRFI